jgi:acyl-CoA thioesterase-1
MDRVTVQAQRRWSFPFAVLRRVVATAGVTLLIVASLLTFPSCIPWMAAVWLAWHSIEVARGRAGWFPLVACAAVMAGKGLPWMPGVVAFGVATCTICLLAVARAAKPSSRRLRIAASGALALLWLVWCGLAIDWNLAARVSRRPVLRPGRPIVLLGDSLTAGVSPHGGYASSLERQISVPVVDLSEEGITAEKALKLLPAMVAAKPQAVVIELGGNDFVRGRSRSETAADLERIIVAARGIGAEVVLMEVPRGFIFDPYFGMERELARRHDLALVPDTVIRMLVANSPHAPPGMWIGGGYLSDDGLHPNAAGNERLAHAIAAALGRP